MHTPQLALPLTWHPLFEDHLFFVGNSNRLAFDWIQSWPWPHCCSCVFGPKSSGKTHLGMLWAKKHSAQWIDHPPVVQNHQHYIWDHFVCASEDLLISFFEDLKRSSATCLFLAYHPPSKWSLDREDVRSRFLTMPCVDVRLPDDDVLYHVLKKCFHDHGMRVSSGLISFLIQRMPRSFDAAQSLTKILHTRFLEEKHIPSKNMIQKILDSL